MANSKALIGLLLLGGLAAVALGGSEKKQEPPFPLPGGGWLPQAKRSPGEQKAMADLFKMVRSYR